MKKLNLKTGIWLLAISLGLLSCHKNSLPPGNAEGSNDGGGADAYGKVNPGSATVAQPWSQTGTDFVTGGGWIFPQDTDTKDATFGVSGGMRKGGYWGDLEYTDHNSGGPKVKSIAVTNYMITGSNMRSMTGTCKIDGSAGFTYTVQVTENGEPGTSDVFELWLSNGYSAAGKLNGGNIILHD